MAKESKRFFKSGSGAFRAEFESIMEECSKQETEIAQQQYEIDQRRHEELCKALAGRSTSNEGITININISDPNAIDTDKIKELIDIAKSLNDKENAEE